MSYDELHRRLDRLERELYGAMSAADARAVLAGAEMLPGARAARLASRARSLAHLTEALGPMANKRR